jgi:HlyD family secretion protein
MKRFARVLIGMLTLTAVSLLLWLTVFKTDPVPVTVYRVASGRVETIVVNSKAGTVRSRTRAQLSPAVSGKVVELTIRRGDRVTKGQLLLRLDDAEYRAQRSGAERALLAAQAAEKQALLEADLAEKDLGRQKPLAADGAISASALESIQSRRDVALAGVTAARERAREAAAGIEVAAASLDKTRIHAPFDGVVADLSTELGEWLSPSPPGVMIPAVIDLVDLDSIYVSAPLDEVDLDRVRVGHPARIAIDAYPDSRFDGAITRIAPYVADQQEQNRTFEVEAEFDDAGRAREFVPGSTADVEIILEAHDNVLRLPSYAILEGEKVLVVRNGKLVAVPVKTGLRNWQFTEITDGLSAGDAVVVSLDRAEVKEGAAAVVTGETEK